MSIAEQLSIAVSDDMIALHLIRNANEWRAIGDYGFAVDLKEPKTTLRLSIPTLYEVDRRLCTALLYLRDNEKINQAHHLLTLTLTVWGYTPNKCLPNEKAGYWERWREVEYEEDTSTFRIEKTLYNVKACRDNTFVVTELLGNMSMRYHSYEIETLCPGFSSAYTVAEQLALSKTEIANHCHQFLRGTHPNPQEKIDLPAFN